LNQLTFELEFVCVGGGGHDHNLHEIESQCHRWRSEVNVQRVWAC